MFALKDRQMTFDRKKLALQATRASMKARRIAGNDYVAPVNVYDACEAHGVVVRFNDISMEGMYDRHPRPRIHISALRPLVRRNLTCAHELGHHVFGHGSTIDEMNNRSEVADHNNPIEYAANQFAYFFTMPTLGVRNALTTRGLNLSTAGAKDLFRVSSHFGVGYTTLLMHLRYGLGILSEPRFRELKKISPKEIRHDVLQSDAEDPMVLVDTAWTAPTVDLETGDFLVLPSKTSGVPKQLEPVGEVPDGFVYRAKSVGVGRVEPTALGTGLFVRVAKKSVVDDKLVGYIGLAKYRHLEDDDDE